MKPTVPGSLLIIFVFVIYFPLLFSVLLNQKYKNTLLQFIYSAIYLSYLPLLSHVVLPILTHRTQKGLTTPLTRPVPSICYLCVGDVYVVLGGSPTGLITLVSSLREIPTVAILHHPFLFGEIPT